MNIIKKNYSNISSYFYKIFHILYLDMGRCDLFKHASAMAYVTLLSLIPSLAVIFSLLALFKPFLGPNSVILIKIKEFILSNLATGTGQIVISYIDQFIANLDLTKIGVTGFAGMLITLILLLRQIEIALNRIWLVKVPRNIFKRFVYFWTFLTLGILIIALSLGILSGFNIENLIPFLGDGSSAISSHKDLINQLSPMVVSFLILTLLYKVVPNCFVSFKHAIIGAAPAAVLFFISGKFYGLFVNLLSYYKNIYGALAALPVFLIWLYILWLIILLGALLAWRSQQTFNLKENIDDDNPSLLPLEKLRNHHLQTICPYIVLLAVYYKFIKADKEGITGFEISLNLNIPSIWVEEAINVLEQLELIILKENKNDHEDLGSHYKKIFPSVPASAIIISDLRKNFIDPTLNWIDEWKCNWPDDLRPALKLLLEDKKIKTFQNVLDRFFLE